MIVDLRELLDVPRKEAVAQYYEEHGYFILQGIEDAITTPFRPVLAEVLGVDDPGLSGILDPDAQGEMLPLEVRQRVARITTSPALADALFAALGPMLTRLIGPLVHISGTFHGQFKGYTVKAVDHGGYEQDFLEVHGAYLLHQDFACASIPTSPSGVTLWVGANTSPDWNLRLYPGTHRLGIYCNRWLTLDDPRLEQFGPPIDFPAQAGTAIVFNSLLLHGTGNPGPRRRVSYDIRFYPLCGFLPSRVRSLVGDPLAGIERGLARDDGDVLRSPLLETQVFLNQPVAEQVARRHSVLNWINYIACITRRKPDAAVPHLVRFANPTLGFDDAEPFINKFHGYPVQDQALHQVRDELGLGKAAEIARA